MRSRSSWGFTLIEVLVSLTIMAMIVTVAFAGLSVGIDSWRRGTRKIDELDRRFALERVIQRQVALADPRLFQGSDRELEFRSTYSLVNGQGDPVWVRYRVDSDKFLYAEMPLPEYSPEHSTESTTQSLGSFSPIVFRYLGSTPAGEPVWLSAWMNQTDLPLAVRFRIADDVITVPLVNRQ